MGVPRRGQPRARPADRVLLAGLWAVVRSAVVQSMAYTGSLFTAFAAWSLHAVLRRGWLLAGTLCILAGLTRATGVAVVVAVGLAAAADLVRHRGRAGDGGRSTWSALVLASAGTLGFTAWQAVVVGRADAYFWVQRASGYSVRRGAPGSTAAATPSTSSAGSSPGGARGSTTSSPPRSSWRQGLLVLAVLDRYPWPQLAYAASVLVMSAGSHG